MDNHFFRITVYSWYLFIQSCFFFMTQFSQFVNLVFRNELHPGICGPFSAGLLLSFQLGDALPGQSLGATVPKPVGNCTLGLYHLSALPQTIFS